MKSNSFYPSRIRRIVGYNRYYDNNNSINTHAFLSNKLNSTCLRDYKIIHKFQNIQVRELNIQYRIFEFK